MKPSSTSSSEPGARRRGWLLTIILVIAMLCVAELVLRIPTVQAALPIRTQFQEAGVTVRLQTLERVLEQHSNVDVLFVGSSVVRCNISPLVFDELVQRDAKQQIVSFNAGLSGFWPPVVRLYLEDLWLPRARPALVVQGIRYSELLSSKRARSYDRIANGVVESSWEKPGPFGPLSARAFESFRVLQYRGTLPAWLARWEHGTPAAMEDDEVRVFTDPRGWTPRTPTLDVVLARHLLSDERPNPPLPDAREYHESIDAIHRSYKAAQRAGAEYVLVNVPEHTFRWSGADGRQRYASYLGTLRQLAAADGFQFIDVTDGDPTLFSSPQEFSDYHHMSPSGARRFTTMLARHLEPRLPRPLNARRGADPVAIP